MKTSQVHHKHLALSDTRNLFVTSLSWGTVSRKWGSLAFLSIPEVLVYPSESGITCENCRSLYFSGTYLSTAGILEFHLCSRNYLRKRPLQCGGFYGICSRDNYPHKKTLVLLVKPWEIHLHNPEHFASQPCKQQMLKMKHQRWLAWVIRCFSRTMQILIWLSQLDRTVHLLTSVVSAILCRRNLKRTSIKGGWTVGQTSSISLRKTRDQIRHGPL